MLKRSYMEIIAIVMFGAFPSLALANADRNSSLKVEGAAAQQLSTRIVLLGTAGGPVPRVKRAQPATLVEVQGRQYLIDAGDGVVRQLATLGYQPQKVQRVFISHLHMDHTAGLATLLGFRWTARAEQPMHIFGPAGMQTVINGAIAFMQTPADIFAQQLPPGPPLAETVRVTEIKKPGPTLVYQDDLVKVTAIENSHYDTMDKGRLPEGSKSYAYRFDTPDKSIVFTGDSGPSENIEKLAAGADVLISEVLDIHGTMRFLKQQYQVSDEILKPQVDHMTKEHLLPEEIGKMASRAKVKMVVLTHVVMGFDNETDMRGYSEGVRRYFDGPVIVGQDFNEF